MPAVAGGQGCRTPRCSASEQVASVSTPMETGPRLDREKYKYERTGES